LRFETKKETLTKQYGEKTYQNTIKKNKLPKQNGKNKLPKQCDKKTNRTGKSAALILITRGVCVRINTHGVGNLSDKRAEISSCNTACISPVMTQ
jgi:hypothetical protein